MNHDAKTRAILTLYLDGLITEHEAISQLVTLYFGEKPSEVGAE